MNIESMRFTFDAHKNSKLKAQRGVNFEDVIVAIHQGYLLDVRPHHNDTQYVNQDILVVEMINQYIYLVPCIQQEQAVELKTVYPSRKATAIYLNK